MPFPHPREPYQIASILLYAVAVIAIISFSFAYYAPCNYVLYNSDHAIHVLMAEDLQLPRDTYFWGQRRLGSLLPVVAHPVGRLIDAHYLYITSVVHYIFLVIGFLVLSSRIKNLLLRLAMCAVIFLPMSEYNALIMIGHPYSSQLVAGALFVLSLSHLRRLVAIGPEENKYWPIGMVMLIILSLLFYGIGIWVSEFSAILAVIPLYFLICDRELHRALALRIRDRRTQVVAITAVVLSALMVWCYLKMRTFSDAPDGYYDKAFLDDPDDIARNFGFFAERARISLLFLDHDFLNNLYNWFLIVVIAGVSILRDHISLRAPLLLRSIVVTSILATVALFLSTWNLRSEFSPRYFIPVYIMICFVVLLALDGSPIRWVKRLISGVFVSSAVALCYINAVRPDTPTPFERYGDYADLPEGTLIGDFWDVYKINSIAIDNLRSIPYEYQTVRNWSWRDEVLDTENFYFLKDRNFPTRPGSPLVQYKRLFEFSGTIYHCNGDTVMLYNETAKFEKIRLKDHRGVYVTVLHDSRLASTSMDSSEAEIFEFVSSRLGTSLRASNGMFVCADQGIGRQLFARSEHPHDWEMFQVIPNDHGQFAFRAKPGGFVSADHNEHGWLVADRDHPGEWEMFDIEPVPE